MPWSSWSRSVAVVAARVSPGAALDRTVVLIVLGAVLLGVAGAVGLYVTRRRP